MQIKQRTQGTRPHELINANHESHCETLSSRTMSFPESLQPSRDILRPHITYHKAVLGRVTSLFTNDVSHITDTKPSAEFAPNLVYPLRLWEF